jgi:predicted anti-sigma-YlaC factor YlaD
MDVWTDRLSEYLDGTLAGSERAALDAHLAGCAACAATLEELRRVVARAQSLQDRPPATDLWPGVAERIGVSPDVVSLPARRARRVAFSIPQLIAASLALVVLGSGAAWLMFRQPVEVAVRRAGPATTITLVSWADSAIVSSNADVLVLRAALDAGRHSGRIDSATVRVLEQSLATIDTAVAQARRALAADPNSVYLHQHIARTLRRKSDFVARASTLVSART